MNFQNLSHDLKNWRAELNNVDNTPELQDVIFQIEDLISTIDQRLAKLKPALALREQFNDLVSDITMFTTKYTEIIREVERPGYSAQDKIKKYEEVSLQNER